MIDPFFTTTPVVTRAEYNAFARTLRSLGSCRPPLQPLATFTTPFCTRSDPGKDDFWEYEFFRSSVSPLLSRRTVSMMKATDPRKGDNSHGRASNRPDVDNARLYTQPDEVLAAYQASGGEVHGGRVLWEHPRRVQARQR